jgi:HEAT repeat protein
MTSEEADAFFAQTLLGDEEDEGAWNAVAALRSDGDEEIFQRAAVWCCSEEALKRARGAAILCQLRRAGVDGPPFQPDWLFRPESYSIITKMLETEQDPMVLDSAIHALGHLGVAGAVPLILKYEDHPETDVRFAVACALGCHPYLDEPLAIQSLLRLTSDGDAKVRDWAVFGLGAQGDADSPEIRAALLRCLDDADEDVREEAAIGLGKRQDERLIPKLWPLLEGPEVKVRIAEAAALLLGLDKDPPEWGAEDYKAALARKFQLTG